MSQPDTDEWGGHHAPGMLADDRLLREQVEGAAERFPVSFAIFGLARAHRAIAAEMLREVGLYLGQEIMLMQLKNSDGQSQISLGRTLGVEHATIAKTVRRMEQAGLVTRTKSSEDRRVSLVHLTAAGRRLTDHVERIWTHLEQVTTAGQSEADRDRFVALARQLEISLAGEDQTP